MHLPPRRLHLWSTPPKIINKSKNRVEWAQCHHCRWIVHYYYYTASTRISTSRNSTTTTTYHYYYYHSPIFIHPPQYPGGCRVSSQKQKQKQNPFLTGFSHGHMWNWSMASRGTLDGSFEAKVRKCRRYIDPCPGGRATYKAVFRRVQPQPATTKHRRGTCGGCI